MTPMRRPCFALLALALAACRGGAPPRPPGGAEQGPLAEARHLALHAARGAAAVDRLIATAQERARAHPEQAGGWIALGRLWVRKARETAEPRWYLSADACAEVALDREPGSPAALTLRGMVLLNDHRFAEARDVARQVVAARPDDPGGWGALSDALLELGDFAGAAAAAQTMVDLKPNLPSYVRASYLRWLTGDVAGARQIIRLAIDAGADGRDPEPRAFALVQAASTFWSEGDLDGAEAGYDLALQGLADYPPALAGKGRVALARGDARGAAALLAKAYGLSPLLETARLLAAAREAAGDAAGAAATRAEVERYGRHIDPRTLALHWATRGEQPEEAYRLAAEERSRRGDVYTLDVVAWAAYRAGRLDEAREASAAATRLGTRDALLLYHRGAILIASGEAEAGRALVRQALALNPAFDPTGAAEARRLVAVAAR
jgi:tetratricopeptide (TPR) repeat protein